MCGICGIIDYKKNSNCHDDLISRMCKEIRHRGPDDEGIYVKNGSFSVGLGHCRLSIIDLSPTGHQPMSNEDKTIWLVFNGEIYNYKELKAELEKNGHIFKSQTDSETLVHLYEDHGDDCVKFLRGMFAFSLWDEKKQTLLLARDRVGKKPLLYFYDGNTFCFASEFSALLASGFIAKRINFKAIDYYLSFGYIPAPLTIYDNVFKLPPAHLVIFKDKKITLKQYWQLDFSKKTDLSEEEAAEEILRLLKEATKIRLYSDVPLGAFLSGGIDSSTIVALMSQLSGTKVKTFSVGFEEGDYNELGYARNIAQRYGTDHHEFIVKPDALKILPLLVEHFGEPYADSSCIPTYYVAQQTRQYVTVALNGDGGDELFAGYERYQAMLAFTLFQRLPHFFQKIIGSFKYILPDSQQFSSKVKRLKRFLDAADLPFQQKYLRLVGIFHNKLKNELYSQNFAKLAGEADSVKFLAPFLNLAGQIPMLDSLLWADTMTYLPNDLLVKVDITSMANSLEARSPFLDHKLMEFCARMPANYKIKWFIKKYILKKAIKDLVPRQNIQRKKMGFGVPVGEWFRNDLKDYLRDILLSKQFFSRGYFNPLTIKQMVAQHIERKQDYTFCLWALLMLELWHRRFID